MGVLDGQPVDAATTNPAFLDANADDTALGKISLNNISDPGVSGSAVNNIQREFNALSSFTGKTTNLPIGTVPSWLNNQVGTPTDNLFARGDALSALFDNSTGHTHDGAPGNGGPISGSSILNVPYRGWFNEGIDLTGVTGLDWDVSTELTGKSPSTGMSVLGVVVNTPYNRAILRQASGPDAGDQFVDVDGNEVYGRVTELAGVWTLSFFVDDGGVETPYSFGSAEDIRWYYQELYDPMVSTPVYDPGAFTPSDNATADIVYATASIAGKVLLANAAPPAIASSGSLGVSTRVSLQDHTHEGVHSIRIDGDLTQALGDVDFQAGTGISLTWSSGKLNIAAVATNTPEVEYRTLTSGEALAKQLTLAFTPNVASKVVVDIIGGTAQQYAVDYTVTGAVLDWNGLGLNSLLDTGDTLRIIYWT